jgi:hypothetical protein
MEQELLEKFRTWFDDYVTGFFSEDEYVNSNLKMKQLHSRRTCSVTRELVDELELDANQKRIAETIALFHDIGRFEQFVRYKTYNDARSVNHCQLGLQVLRETNVLAPLDRAEREFIEKAIEYHGRKELPSDLDDQCLLFSKVIRDADKVDVLYIITEYHRHYRDCRGDFMLETLLLELPDEPEYSPRIVAGLLNGRRIDHKELRTMNDMRLLLIGWVYDVNFAATLKQIREHGFLDVLFDFLPKTCDIESVRRIISRYVDSRITAG